ncbi:hypothetical protein DPMN_040348 [Dreissena polymorpha]|uniref:Uncharacterized protein n=1 Tax=Dreissena polymorpha TaxID=45954 RepID=A0A9D4CXI5_DREPO|nr:hypothetical protein DPMN_040348 [Dreissena polymorpha]
MDALQNNYQWRTFAETEPTTGVQQYCEEDELIREFGLHQLGRLGPEKEQRTKDQENVLTKMRTLALLLKKLNEGAIFEYPLYHCICASKFSSVVKAVKELCEES